MIAVALATHVVGCAYITKLREVEMARWHIDCRDYPSEMNCTVAISADNEKELLDAAVQHAVAVHKHEDTPEFRNQLKTMLKQQD
jgi:predicted small metal-binding protein